MCTLSTQAQIQNAQTNYVNFRDVHLSNIYFYVSAASKNLVERDMKFV